MTDVDAYLERLGYEGPTDPRLDTLQALQYAHLVAVPFENLDVVGGVAVSTDVDVTLAKLVNGRGGWCFENNGAFAWLLEQLGFRVRRLGAAVLLQGAAVLVDHLTLEVELDHPYLVDVGFGDSFVSPLRLDLAGPQHDRRGVFELLGSPQGTTLSEVVDGVPEARYRFTRVAHTLAEFEPASRRLQADADGHFRTKPFATRLLGRGVDRVTLLGDRLKVIRSGVVEETPVAPQEWDETLDHWFSMRRPDHAGSGSGVVGVDDGE